MQSLIYIAVPQPSGDARLMRISPHRWAEFEGAGAYPADEASAAVLGWAWENGAAVRPSEAPSPSAPPTPDNPVPDAAETAEQQGEDPDADADADADAEEDEED